MTKIAGSLAKTGEHVPRELGQKTTDYDVLSFTTGFLEQGVGLGLAKFHPAGRPPLAEKDSPPEIQNGGQGLTFGYPAGRSPFLEELQPDGDAVQDRDPVSQGADPVADGKADANFVSGTGAAVKDAVLDYQGQIQGGTDLSEDLFDSPVGGHSSGFASEEGHGRADVHYEALVPNIGPLAKTGEHVLCDHAQGKGLGLAKLYPAGRPPPQTLQRPQLVLWFLPTAVQVWPWPASFQLEGRTHTAMKTRRTQSCRIPSRSSPRW